MNIERPTQNTERRTKISGNVAAPNTTDPAAAKLKSPG
jgi:hypothetical protein